MEKSKILIVCRGIPGGGKSYTAKEMVKKYNGGRLRDHIFSTDDYFIREVLEEKNAKLDAGEEIDHEYYKELEFETYRANWTPAILGKAHGWNFHRAKAAIDKGVTPVIIDNTNIKAREAKNYVKYAIEQGYEVIVKEPDSPWWQDHASFLRDKQKNGTALEDFARFLAGFHQGMEVKYGVKGNQHGVPLDAIRGMIRRWEPDLTPDKILNERSS